MFKGLTERFFNLVTNHIVPPGDGPEVRTLEDKYAPDVLSVAKSAMVPPAVVHAYRQDCEELGIDWKADYEGFRKKEDDYLKQYLAMTSIASKSPARRGAEP